MGQVPPKYFLPSSPYGSSPASKALSPTQPGAVNPQTPLLPPNFSDPGTMAQASPSAPLTNATRSTLNNSPLRGKLYGNLFLLVLLLLPANLWATTTVTGTLQNLGTGTVGQGAFVRFWLRGCGGNQPFVSGTALIAPSQGGVFFFDLPASSSGVISGTVYSTRDSTGLLGGDITCGTSTTSVWYGLQIFVGGKGGPEVAIHAKNSATLNINSLSPITTTPVVTAPTGDSTYLRLNAGNSPLTGALSSTSTISDAGGTHSGTETFNGALNSANLAAGNVANKPSSADAIRYVSATGNDSNDGLSMGTAKATLSGAVSTLPNCTPIAGAYGAGTPDSTFTAPCGVINLAANPNGYSLSSTLTLNGKLIKIVGLGTLPVGINCTSNPCIFYNNVSPYTAGPDELYPTDGGLYNLTLNGNGSASQLGLSVTEANGLHLQNVRFTNFNGTSAIGAQFRTVTSGNPIEEEDFNFVIFDNCTNGLWFHGGTQNSFGHNFFRHVQWLLNNGQTGWVLDGTAGVYSSMVDGVFNAEDPVGADSATAISISGTAAIRGSQFNLPIDNGSGLTINLCSGCTASNFQITGMIGQNPPQQVSQDNSPYYNVTTPNYLTSPCWLLNGVIKWCWELDGSNQFGAVDAVGVKETAWFFPNSAGGGIGFNGTSSGFVQVRPQPAAGSPTIFYPSPGLAASANTLAVITTTLKKGSGVGNYTNATTSYTVADSTNLCYTVTIPTGWKLVISTSGALSTATAAVVAQAALTDNAACSTANAGILVETAPIQGAGIGVADAFALDWIITGDGAAHSIALQFKTSNVADTASLINSSATVVPILKFELMPSN